MTTPGAMSGVVARIREQLDWSKQSPTSQVAPMNSYAAGYRDGYQEALLELLEHVTGARE